MSCHYKPPSHHLSKVFNSVLERQFLMDKSITSSKMSIYQDVDWKLEMKLGRCAIPGDLPDMSSLIIEHKMLSFDALPIDLSKRSTKTADSVAATLTNKNDLNNKSANGVETEKVNDEPLNLSKCNVKKDKVALTVSSYVPNKALSPDLLQKRGRLEETVKHIRQCSVGEGPKCFPKNTNGSHRSCDTSDPDSECDTDCTPMKRSLSCSAMTSTVSERHRRKRTAPYPNRAGDILHVDCGKRNGDDAFRQRLYPVLRQQLLLSVDGDDELVALNESDVDSYVDDNAEDETMSPLLRSSPIVTNGDTTYAYYANLFQNLQNSFPAAAQGLLMTANINDVDDAITKLKGNNIPSPSDNFKSSETNVNVMAPDVVLKKRARRALTGKHVKQGTGASPTTLLTLRQKLEQKMIQKSKSSHVIGLQNGSLTVKDGKNMVKKKNNKKKVVLNV
ncbi:hypothetical protein CHUAL_004049 [Chamberlinius hualienensis]